MATKPGLRVRPAEVGIGATVLVGVAVALVFFFSSSSASGVNLTSAALVPADTALYVGINTDLESSQWVASFTLLERLGVDDPKGSAKGLIETGNLVAPSEEYKVFGDPKKYAGVDVNLADMDYGQSIRTVTGDLAPSNTSQYKGYEVYNQAGDKLGPNTVIAAGAKVRIRRLAPGGSTGYLVAGLSWEDDIAPLLGGDAGVFLRSVEGVGLDAGLADLHGGVVFRARDAALALKRITIIGEGSFQEDTYEGVPYLKSDSGFVIRLGEHIVLTSDVDSLKAIIEVSLGKRPALSASPDFQTLRDKLTTNFLLFVYGDFGKIVDGALTNPMLESLVGASALGEQTGSPFAVVFGAKDGAFEAEQAVIVGELGKWAPLVQAGPSRFASLVPVTTVLFASVRGSAALWQEAASRAPESGQADSFLEDFLDSSDRGALHAGAELLAIMTGESALAVWFPQDQVDRAQFVLLAEATDADATAAALATFGESIGGAVREERVGTMKITVRSPLGQDDIAYAAGPGFFAIGSPEGVRAALETGNPSLAQHAVFARTTAKAASALGSFLFLNLSGASRAANSDPIGGLASGFIDPFEAFLLNAVAEENTVRVSGLLTLNGE